MTTVEIRALTVEDWREYRAVRLAALAEAPYAFGSTLEREEAFDDDRWRERLANPANLTLFATLEGEPIGLAGGLAPDGVHDNSVAHPAAAWLVQMWVDPIQRSRGIGAALVARVIEWARALAYPELRLWVTEGNAPAERLYARLGFADTGERQPVRDDDPSVETGMVLRL
jgi:GNAT superfamily N-acetyltransferase